MDELKLYRLFFSPLFLIFFIFLQWLAHLRALLCALVRGLRVGRGGGVGRIAARARVRGRAQNYSLVYLHYRSLDGVWESPTGRGGAHVHHHVALRRGHLEREEEREGGGLKKKRGGIKQS